MTTLIILCCLGALGLLCEIFNFTKQIHAIILFGLATSFVFLVRDWNTNVSYFNDMIRINNYSLAFSGLLIAITFLWFVLAPGYLVDKFHRIDYFSLIIFALIGALLLVSFSNIIMLFLGLEILSISMYILAGINKKSLASNEAALKYFLMGSFATCFLLFGIALIYGQTGTFNISLMMNAIATGMGNHTMLNVGVLLIMIALLFKVSAVPFHFWTPDVYQGSPTIITAYMSTVVKTAAFAAFLKLFTTLFGTLEHVWFPSIWVIAAATILIGNISAVFQTNVKRMLAYSSISHAGYMLLAILAMNKTSSGSLLFYTVAYSLSSIGSFAILLFVNRNLGSENIDSFQGLANKNPLLAAANVIAMLSLSGIPPTAGFFAKYFIFSSAIQSGLTSLVIIAIGGSLVGVFFYFRLIIAMFKEKNVPHLPININEKTIILITSIATILLGIFPGLIADLLG